MSLDSHLSELERRHKDLERKLEELMSHPSVDSLELHDLKRQKLVVKDEIERLRSSSTLH
ncbi:DUF465 domain-containing protein [Rhizobiales bacterium]|uniref:YdcH family protein n=1 Tax=Hongsoonwoonella zoysiae TaxID=2821844 RepID=UPI0015611C32|nr:DUF465 domain-containing protein [Hongsoonwoonella zoysiae]NRG17344.1 DUF465 domain-containing protein [Hongsoonwoonella zoysiae]